MSGASSVCNRAINSMLNLRGKTLSPAITLEYRVFCQRKSRNKVTDTYRLQGRGEIKVRMQSKERRNMWIITIVVVDDAFWYFALEMVGGDGYGSPDLAISWALYTDRFNVTVCSNGGSVSGRSTTWACATSSTSAGTALLASRISTWWCHRNLGRCLGRVLWQLEGSEVGCAGAG